MSPTAATLTFALRYSQRAELDVAGQSIGSLEMHNPGMCWPETTTHTTSAIQVSAGQFVPMRLRYQSVGVCLSLASPFSAFSLSCAGFVVVWWCGVGVVWCRVVAAVGCK
jgi:hypothetical protein